MQIAHIGIWTNQLEELKRFYTTFFGGVANDKYINPMKRFESYFIRFDGGTAIEIMSRTDVKESRNHADREYIGLAHLAFSVGSKTKVDQLTEQLQQAGYRVASEPRTTGDGFYESVILDPDGNRIEICGLS